MEVYFTRLKVGWPEPQNAPEDWDGCWRVYTVCKTAKPSSSTTLADLRQLERKDMLDARVSYVSLLNKAHTGQPLSSLYDEKQCHETHSFKRKLHDNFEEKIFRIWGAGDIRINFIYLPDRRIVILKTWPKRKDKLSTGDKELLETLAKEVLDTYENHDFDSREI
ncbi:MAG: hypothetical protein HGA75_05440 [Thiobacillus sp.]|nr:hypothetical protein [Thiobacillus sp.]